MAADKNATAAPKKLRVTLVRGLMGKKPDHRATVAGLGLKWRSHSVEVADTPEIRGMLAKIGYMLTVTEAKA
jgi:large subunit ribosomal protein L30